MPKIILRYITILPLDEYLLEDMIDSIILFYIYCLSKDHLPGLYLVAVKSNPDFPFEFDLTICGFLESGVTEPLCSSIELQIGVSDEFYSFSIFFDSCDDGFFPIHSNTASIFDLPHEFDIVD